MMKSLVSMIILLCFNLPVGSPIAGGLTEFIFEDHYVGCFDTTKIDGSDSFDDIRGTSMPIQNLTQCFETCIEKIYLSVQWRNTSTKECKCGKPSYKDMKRMSEESCMSKCDDGEPCGARGTNLISIFTTACEVNPCDNGGSCVNDRTESRRYRCECPVGFQNNSAKCKDIDECSVDNKEKYCGNNGSCENTIGSYRCDCPDGFDNSSGPCEDVDECSGSNPCNGTYLSCSNTVGSYDCHCLPGSRKNLTTGDCEDVDECEEELHSCPPDEECINTTPIDEQIPRYKCDKLVPSTSTTSSSRTFSPTQSTPARIYTTRMLTTKTRSTSTPRPTRRPTPAPSDPPPDNTFGIVIGIGVVFIVLLSAVLIVMILLILRMKRGNRNDPILKYLAACGGASPTDESANTGTYRMRPRPSVGQHPPNLSLDIEKAKRGACKPPPAEKALPPPTAKHLSCKIPLEDLQKRIQALKTKQNAEFDAEYKSIPKCYNLSRKAAEHNALMSKNKFRDILPYDDTRVVLKKLDHDPHSHYVNASHISGYETKDTFIASQGPWYTTLEDFWRMVWETNSLIIVMVTQYVEMGVRKVEQYIPEAIGKSEKHGDIGIQLLKEDIRSDFTTRLLSVSNGSLNPRSIKQFHFTAWPDHGVPSHGASLANFQKKVKQEMIPGHPVIVHCSAGVGRTGTYIALDQLLQQGEKCGYVDILGCTQHLRKQRSHMVQTLSQYIFLHDTILEAFAVGNTTIACSAFVKEYQRLKRYSRVSTKPRILSQFELLEMMKMEDDKQEYSQAHKPENKNKIRDLSIIASNSHRVILKTTSADEQDFINAQFVDGYKKKRAFITSQLPLGNTLSHFWTMVSDYDCRVLVFLTPENVKNIIPAKEEPQKYGNIVVSQVLASSGEGFTMYDLVIKKEESKKEDSEETNGLENSSELLAEPSVRVFILKEDEAHLSFDPLSEVYSGVQRWQQKNDTTPVVVVCNDGAKLSGQYVAASCLFDMINTTQEFDVFYIVKLIRLSNKHFIHSMMLYEELYNMVGRYIESFDDYCNFK